MDADPLSEDSAIPDAALCLTLTAAVEQVLEVAITTHFVIDETAALRMFDDGPLSTFAAKIKIGEALGIYPRHVRKELDLLRHIRNLFAHAKEAKDFTSPEIRAGCNQLVIPSRFSYGDGRRITTGKGQLITAARMLFLYLEDTTSPKPMSYATHRLAMVLFPDPSSAHG